MDNAQVVAEIRASNVVSLDFETITGKGTALIPYEATPEGGAVAWRRPDGTYAARYFSFRDFVATGKHPVSWQWFNEMVLDALWEDENKKMVCHNAKYDIQVALRRREPLPLCTEEVEAAMPKCQVHDTMVLSFLVDENIPRSLKELSRIYLKKPRPTYEQTQREISGLFRYGKEQVSGYSELGWRLYDTQRRTSQQWETDLFATVDADPGYRYKEYVQRMPRPLDQKEFIKKFIMDQWESAYAAERRKYPPLAHYPRTLDRKLQEEVKAVLKEEAERAWLYYCMIGKRHLTHFDRLVLSLPPGLSKSEFLEKFTELIQPKIMRRTRQQMDDKMAAYAEEDVLDPLKLWDILYPKVSRDPRLLTWYHEVEMPWFLHMVEVEITGVNMDADLLRLWECDIGLIYEQDRQAIQQRIEQEYGIVGFNPRSHPQIKELLWDKLKLEPPKWAKKTKEGVPKTDADTLEYLAKQQGADICHDLLNLSGLSKLHGTYLKPLADRSENNIWHRIRTSFNTVRAVTGRAASSAPNLQNIPNANKMPEVDSKRLRRNRRCLYGSVSRNMVNGDGVPLGWHVSEKESGKYRMDPLRRAFVAPAGYKLIVADYSQIELRFIAHISQDPNLLYAYRHWNCECGASGDTEVVLHKCPVCGAPEGERDKLHPEQPVKHGFCLGLDIHSLTGLSVGLFDKYGPKEGRKKAKPVNFGLCYGEHYTTLAVELDISEDEAKEIYNGYFRLYPRILEFHKAVEKRIRERGWFLMPMGGRYRRFIHQSEAIKKDRLKKGEIRALVREAVNNLPQGGAGDILKRGALEFVRRKRRIPALRSVAIVLQVHDELVLLVQEELATQTLSELVPALETTDKISVPIVVDAVVCNNWNEGK